MLAIIVLKVIFYTFIWELTVYIYVGSDQKWQKIVSSFKIVFLVLFNL